MIFCHNEKISRYDLSIKINKNTVGRQKKSVTQEVPGLNNNPQPQPLHSNETTIHKSDVHENVTHFFTFTTHIEIIHESETHFYTFPTHHKYSHDIIHV